MTRPVQRVAPAIALALFCWAAPASAVVVAPPYDTLLPLGSGTVDEASGGGGTTSRTVGPLELLETADLFVKIWVESPSFGTVLDASFSILDAGGVSFGSATFGNLQGPFRELFGLNTSAVPAGTYDVVLTTTLSSTGGSLARVDYDMSVLASPLPAALPLTLAALAGLGLLARRRPSSRAMGNQPR